jgi:hypothetical protein
MKTLIFFFTSLGLFAQTQELGLTLGRVIGQDRSIASTSLKLDGGTALQANYGHRIAGGGAIGVYAAVNVLASPLREVSTANRGSIRDFATFYLTPEIRVKFAAGAPVSPYVFGGGGLAVYEHSTLTIGGAPNPGPRTSNTGAGTYGAGVDVKGWRWIGLRGEIRDTFTGSPRFNLSPSAAKQHNWTATGGFVLRWGR